MLCDPASRAARFDQRKLRGMDLTAFTNEPYCYLTTTGRVTGEPREIEIWFGISGSTLYMLSGGRDRSNWVKNIRKQPEVTIRIKDHTFATEGLEVPPATDEDALARRLLVGKYQPCNEGELTTWGEKALPMAFELTA
ncbi:MAG: nitroreductase/quinone reductase family protein [Tepidiformaceae bacterium]